MCAAAGSHDAAAGGRGMTLRQRGALGAIVALYLALALAYGLVTPLWEAPDEPHHYAYALQLAQGGGLPRLDPVAPGPWRQEGGQPPLYYALLAGVIGRVPGQSPEALYTPNPHVDLGRVPADGNIHLAIHGADEAWPYRGVALGVHLARLVSALLGVATVLGAHRLGRVLAPDAPALALGAAALTAFNPMFLFISGAVNNDTLTIALATQAVALLVMLLQREACWGHWLLAGALLGLAALAKMSALALLAPYALVAAAAVVRHGWRQAGRAALGLLPLLAIAGWWYGRNLRLYGELSGLGPFLDIIGRRHPVPTLAQLWGEREGFARSYLGLFGWMNLPAPGWAYALLGGLLGLGWLLAPWALWQRARGGARCDGWAWALMALWPLALLAALLRWTLLTPATQGRLLFPALGCLSLWAALGVQGLLPRRWGAWALGLAVAAFVAVSAALPWVTLAPAYRAPKALQAEALPAAAQRLQADLGGGVRLLAVEPPVGPAAPGQTLKVTLYWQAAAALERDYSIYLHLVGQDGRIVAQRDRYPVQGLLPTSCWLPGAIYRDVWALPLPETLHTPEELQLLVGLYEAGTGARPGEGVMVAALEAPARLADGVPNPMRVRLEGGIALVGYAVEPTAARPGETLTLTLYWLAEQDQAPRILAPRILAPRRGGNLSVFCQVLAAGGRMAAQHDGWPQEGERPTGTWRRGELIVDRHVLTVHADAPEGVWPLLVGLYDGEGRRRTVLGAQGQAVSQEVVLTPIRILAAPEP